MTQWHEVKWTHTVVTKMEIWRKDQNSISHQAVNTSFSAVKPSSVIITVDSSLSGRLEKCRFSCFHVGIISQPPSLLLGLNKAHWCFMKWAEGSWGFIVFVIAFYCADSLCFGFRDTTSQVLKAATVREALQYSQRADRVLKSWRRLQSIYTQFDSLTLLSCNLSMISYIHQSPLPARFYLHWSQTAVDASLL